MKLVCPKCHSPIGAENVNVATDLAKCTMCNEIFKASDLVADVDLSRDLQPPVGSKIVVDLYTSEHTVFIPSRGFRWSDLYTILFATFWCAFIAFWSWGASRASLLFAAFSIPFWIVGIAMWTGILVGATETQTIDLDYDALVLSKRAILFSRTRAIPYAEIGGIDTETPNPRNPFRSLQYMRPYSRISRSMGMPLPTISHGTKKVHFAEYVSEAEMEWLVRMLKALVYRKTGRKV